MIWGKCAKKFCIDLRFYSMVDAVCGCVLVWKKAFLWNCGKVMVGYWLFFVIVTFLWEIGKRDSVHS